MYEKVKAKLEQMIEKNRELIKETEELKKEIMQNTDIFREQNSVIDALNMFLFYNFVENSLRKANVTTNSLFFAENEKNLNELQSLFVERVELLREKEKYVSFDKNEDEIFKQILDLDEKNFNSSLKKSMQNIISKLTKKHEQEMRHEAKY